MSIKICVITPISHLREFGNLGEMDMSLSHLIVDEPDGAYARYYKQQREKGRFVILDNSAFELEQQGRGLDPDPVLDAAEVTNPSEVIATDVLFDGEATIESTKRFIQRMKDRGVFGKYQIMGVVQGKDVNEWLDCFHRLLSLPINTIGLSKLSIPVSFLGDKESSGCVSRARLDCTATIDHIMNIAYYRNITAHLLGGDNWTAWEMNKQKHYPWIRSNDSSCAVWYGSYEQVFNEEGKIEDIILEKPDLENKDPYTARRISHYHLTHGNQASILRNIAVWHKASKV